MTATTRAAITALACRAPRDHQRPWVRWAGEQLAQVAVEEKPVASISPRTVRRWLRADKLRPWRYHAWHWSGLAAYIEHRVTNALAESWNTQIQLLKAKARGFRYASGLRRAILFHPGQLDLYPHELR